MAMRVCEELQALGATVCLLSRGYGGSEERGEAVVSDGRKILMGPGDAGDEPYLLAQSLPGVPVLVGKDRRATGRLAMERFEPMAIVLDDGMQFYQLHRDLDIVMLDAVRPFDNGWCLPRGLLREPPGHLRRASLVVISNSQLAGPEQVASLRKRIARLAPAATIVTGDYEPRELRPLGGGDAAAVDWLKGRRVASLCGIGNPEAFESSLARLGAKVVSSTRLRDHAKARLVDLETATGSARATGAEAIVVTEKDAVKLPSVSHPLPFLALVSRLAVSDEAVLRSMLIGLVRRDQP
jgi:tetraacyldisaccharide 4'-kinase